MGLIWTVHRMAEILSDLAIELELRGLHRSSYALHTVINRVRWLKRICIYTKEMMAGLESLNEKIDKTTEKMISEGLGDLKKVDEHLTGFAMDLDYAVRGAIYSYARARLLLAILMALYSTTSILSISASITSELATKAIHIIIWLSVSLYILMLLDLTAMLIPVLAIPLASVVSFLCLGFGFVASNLLLTLVHAICLSASVSFVTVNVIYYRLMLKRLIMLRDKIENLANNLKKTLSKSAEVIQLHPADLNRLALDLYGDKAYELIKYVNDMQSLAK